MAFYIEKECGNQNITRESHCGVEFGNGTSGVISYGSILKGKFEGDPDIAGKGVSRLLQLFLFWFESNLLR